MPKQAIQPADVSTPASYSQVIRAGNTVYLAGQTPVDVNGNVVGIGDPAAQAEQVFTNIDRCLTAAGATTDDVVRVTMYVTDARFTQGLGEARRRHFRAPNPVSTLLIVAALARPEFLVEVECIAYLGD